MIVGQATIFRVGDALSAFYGALDSRGWVTGRQTRARTPELFGGGALIRTASAADTAEPVVYVRRLSPGAFNAETNS